MAQWLDNEIRMQIDALAASYGRVHGVRPDRMRIGHAVAREIEGPQADGHPLHRIWESPTPGVWFPSRPILDVGWWARWKIHRRCRKDGGHWWHPADAMILWFCCRCGKDRDGMPKDGT